MKNDIEELRAERYADARTLWTGNFWRNEQEMKIVEIVNKESIRIFELEQQYSNAQAALDELLHDTEQRIMDLEEESQAASSGISRLEKELDNFKKSQSRQKAITENELQQDHNTYQNATRLLDERLRQSQLELQSVKETIDNFEPREYLKNPKAQELYLQLRALLTAQEKEIRSKLRTTPKTQS